MIRWYCVVKTVPVTFVLGYNDKVEGRNYHRDYNLWDEDDQMIYEEGRLVAAMMLAAKVRCHPGVLPDEGDEAPRPFTVAAYEKAIERVGDWSSAVPRRTPSR